MAKNGRLAIATIQASNADAALDRNIDNAWTEEIAVEVPSTGISIIDLDRLLRRNQWVLTSA